MAEPTLNYVSCRDAKAEHRMAYWQWGDAQAPHTIVCAHGLSRQGRDFDVLAQALVAQGAGAVQVLCPDVVGRGQSDWLQDPTAYGFATYVGDMFALLTQRKPQTLDWVGTSMGGIIGVAVSANGAAVGLKVRKLVLNDVGPVVQWESIQRIGNYLGRSMRFDSVQQAADAMWAVSTTFGPHTPAQWLALSQHMVKSLPDGGVTLHYDPQIAVPFRAVTQEALVQGEAQMWQVYDSVQSDTLLLRGAVSDLLSRETAQQMTQRGPHAQLVEFAGIGHAPTLIADDQVHTVTRFLLG